MCFLPFMRRSLICQYRNDEIKDEKIFYSILTVTMKLGGGSKKNALIRSGQVQWGAEPRNPMAVISHFPGDKISHPRGPANGQGRGEGEKKSVLLSSPQRSFRFKYQLYFSYHNFSLFLYLFYFNFNRYIGLIRLIFKSGLLFRIFYLCFFFSVPWYLSLLSFAFFTMKSVLGVCKIFPFSMFSLSFFLFFSPFFLSCLSFLFAYTPRGLDDASQTSCL